MAVLWIKISEHHGRAVDVQMSVHRPALVVGRKEPRQLTGKCLLVELGGFDGAIDGEINDCASFYGRIACVGHYALHFGCALRTGGLREIRQPPKKLSGVLNQSVQVPADVGSLRGRSGQGYGTVEICARFAGSAELQ